MHYVTKVYDYFSSLFFRIYHYILIPLRYKLRVIGGERIAVKLTDPDAGILFLATHPSHLDATLLTLALLDLNYQINIWTLAYVFKNPYTKLVARKPDTVKLMKVPDIFESRLSKHAKQMRRLIRRTVEELKEKQNVLFFPSGSQKHSAREEIHGKSAVQRILQQYPNVNIVLIRTTGMWGSRFSKAVKKNERSIAKGDNWIHFLWNLTKIILFNFIIFIPKRKITIEFDPVGEDFPRKGTRQEINRYLEDYFNRGYGPLGEPLLRVPDYFWKAKYVPVEYHLKSYKYDLDEVSQNLKNDVIEIVAKTARMKPSAIEMDMLLDRDLALDSLEVTEVLTEIEKKYDIPKYLPKNISSVGHLIALTAQIPIEYIPIEGKFHEIRQEVPIPVRAWHVCAGFVAGLFGLMNIHR